jgi:hypothetical protein
MVLIAPANTVVPRGFQVNMCRCALQAKSSCRFHASVQRGSASSLLLCECDPQIVFENCKLTANRVFYVPGVKEDSWNKVPAALLSVPLIALSAQCTTFVLC